MVWSLRPVAAILTVTPGAATVLVLHSAARGGRREAFATTVGNEVGVLAWAIAAALGLAAVVAASALAFTIVKIAGAIALVYLGARALVRWEPLELSSRPAERRARSAVRTGLVTAIANPKLAAFYLALFPQFVPDGESVLLAALVMAGLLVALDFVWYSVLAAVVARAARRVVESAWLKRAQQTCGAVLVGLGVRLAFEPR
jgi:threonine/homoserine/homoserine lactone efflux protein